MSNTLPTLSGAARRTALKSALRGIPGIADIADKACGKRNVSELTVAELDIVAQAAGIQLDKLAITPVAKPVQSAPVVQDVAPIAQDSAGLDADAVEREVQAVLATPFAGLGDAVRQLVQRALTPRVVEVERVIERIVNAPLPSSEQPSVPGTFSSPGAVALSPDVQVIAVRSAADVFEIDHPVLRRIMVEVRNDPDAPKIDPDYAFDADTLALVLWRKTSLSSVLLSGPRGTGKTTFFKQIAARLGSYFALLSFDRTTEIDPLIGQIELANGNTFWRDGALTAAMRRVGAIVLFDEPDTAKAGSLAALHPVLNDRQILIPRTGERVEAADDVWFVAAANTTGHGDDTGVYVDRNMLDGAFLDRFADIILMPYPSEATERSTLVRRTGISKAAARTLVSFARATRERADKEQDIASGIGMRRLIAWASGLLSGLRPGVIFASAVITHHNREEGEVLWQLYKTTVNEASLTSEIEQVDAPDSAAADTDVI